ncbi:MAG: family 20 glycosylhydrolase [Eubacterium sp.]
MSGKANKIAPVLTVSNGRVVVSELKGYNVEFLGADFPQIVDDDFCVHTPLTDMTVTLSFICTDGNGNRTEADVPLNIKGEHKACSSKPQVIPEPAQWYPVGKGSVKSSDIKNIAFSSNELEKSVFLFAADAKKVLNRDFTLSQKESAQQGDIFFELNSDVAYLGSEGYVIKTDAKGILVTVSAEAGAVWAGKTVLQLLSQKGFPFGEMRDYPRYPVRGFMLDVGRRPMSLNMLRRIVEYMSWYKMNDFQIHLSDNHIFLENYSHNGDAATFDAYEAFRLESSVKNKKGETATAKDHSYTKDEFRQFIAWASDRGVRIVPELDVPAHALSLTKVFPEYMVRNKTSPLMPKRPLTDHIDVSKPEAVDFIKRIYDDYTGGENPVFGSDVTVHIGADEFLTDYGAYRRFINEIVPHIKKTNKVRMWGGLTWIKDKPATPIVPEAIKDVQINLWSSQWADGREMYDMGYELINTIDHYLYMVPNGSRRRGMYTDYLNKNKVFKGFEPSRVRLKGGRYSNLPAGEKRVLGGVYALWHDNIDKRASGLTEGDTFDRFLDSAPLMAEKTWGSMTCKHSAAAVDNAAAVIGAPFEKKISSTGKFDFSALETENASCSSGTLTLNGGSSYAVTGQNNLPLNTELTVDIMFNEVKPGQIIMESEGLFSSPYDLRITDNGKLGFTREGYEYEFDYTPQAGKRIHLIITARALKTAVKTGRFFSKKAKGKFVHNNMVKKDGIKNSTLLIPCMRIGSKTNSVNAKIYGISYRSI